LTKVVVGMSGGVDSTVAVFLLQQAGYDVYGVMLRLWKAGGVVAESVTFQEQMAAESAQTMDVPFEVLDVQDQFRQSVVEYFIQGYQSGITPNPCFYCNRKLKFDALINYADRHNIYYVSSGHYARVHREGDAVKLIRGLDAQKDQSYMLASLHNEQIERLVLPLGELKKNTVRQIAEEQGFRASASKESQDVCFLPEGDYASFLLSQHADIHQPGEIVNRQGEVIGSHMGLAFYTIGQRKGLGIFAPEPTYVLEKEMETNRLVVGSREELGKRKMVVKDVYWHQPLALPSSDCKVAIRYHARPVHGKLSATKEGLVQVDFSELLRDITPGQAAVFYHGDEVIGSGIIAEE
jgi:tRNA-specific 2-thiouridylase